MASTAPTDAAARHAQSCRIVDVTRDEGLRSLTVLASRLCGVESAYIALFDQERRWLSLAATPVQLPFSDAGLPGTVFIEDASMDQRWAEHPLVAGPPHLRLVAASPLRRANDELIGALCVGSSMAGTLAPDRHEALRFAAEQVVTHLELRRAMMEIERLRQEHRQNEELLRDSGHLLSTLMREVPLGLFILDGRGHPYYANARAAEILGKGA